MKVIVATNNAHKIDEIQTALSFEGWEFVSLGSLGDYPEPIEDGASFEDNARIKARAAYENTGLPSIADDSGLVVDALDGAPGVLSARYAGEHGDSAKNNALLLANLRELPLEARTARFVSVLVFIDPSGKETVARGVCEGRIGFEQRGDQGFGYDPLFYPDAFDGSLSMAQITMNQKNSISHRGNALRALKALIEE